MLGFDDFQCRFEPSRGAGDLTEFLKLSVRVKPDDRPLVGLYDADARGRKEFDRLKTHHKVDGTEVRVLDKNKRIYAMILPVPSHLGDAKNAFDGINQELPLPIEFMFDREVIENAVTANVLALRSRTARIANDELPLEVRIDDILQGKIGDEFIYLTKKVTDSSKSEFADWVVNQDSAAFEPFRSIFESLTTTLSEAPAS